MESENGRPLGRWSVAAGLTWVQFDDGPQWIVYSADSADVHLVTESAHTLWTLLAASPAMTMNELLAEFAARQGRSLDNEIGTAAADAVNVMDRVGLIQPVAG